MKKVLSFVLVLCMVLSSLTFAFADTTTALKDVDGNANEQAITVVNDLGIVTGYTDGTFKPAQNVTRAEFAAMITRALDIPESALKGYTATSFKDTTGYTWAVPYLAFCNDKGIMLGDGNGNAMPGRTINMNEAMTMMLRAMGLTNNSALLVGSWPANYVTIAKNVGLYDDVLAATTVDRASAAQIIYNALTKPTYVVNAEGNTTGAAPIINSLASGSDEIVNYADDSIIALADYAGAFATVYRNTDGDIVAVDVKSEALTGSFNAAGKFEADDVEYTLTGVAVPTKGAIIDNTVTSTTALTAGTIATVAGTDTVTLHVDKTGKSIDTVYSVAKWTITAAEQATSDTQDEITISKKLAGKKFTQDDDKNIDESTFVIKGVASLADIKEDNVLYVYTGANDEIVKVEVGTKTAEGLVQKIYDDEGTTTYAIAGTEYVAASENGITGFTTSVPAKAGDEGTAYLDVDGEIFAWDATKTASGNYAVVTATVAAIGRDNTIVLVDKTGTEKEYKLSTDADNTTTAAFAKNTIVEFDLNKDGEVKTITKAETATGAAGKLNDAGTIFGTKKVAADVVVFVITDDGVELGSLKDITTGENITLAAIVEDATDGIKAILVDDDYTGNSDDTYGIITKQDATGVDADGESVQLVNMFLEGKEMKDVMTDVTVSVDVTSNAALQKISVDADGVVTKVTDAGVTTDGGVVAAYDTKASTVTIGSVPKELAKGVVIYVWDEEDGWTVTTAISSLREKTVVLYDTDKDVDGFEVVMAK